MLKQGSIVRAWVHDPEVRNPKTRPLDIVTPSHEITAAAPLVAVAVTGQFSDPLAADEVPLPFHPRGKANSGLRKPCVAKCSWIVTIRSEDVFEQKGFLSTERLVAILEKIGKPGGALNDEQN